MSVETDEFASMLRELKDRSGRSYGTLATRLHVSTSTLHRYCNGAAVPNEYAPVERFARVCGAGADELVELHRRWILADAARRREPAREPVRTEPAEPQPTPVVTVAPEAPDAPLPATAQEATLPPVDALHSARSPQGDPADGETRRRRLPYPRILLSAAAVALVAAAIPLLVPSGHGGTPSAAPPSPTAADAPSTPAAPAPVAGQPSAPASDATTAVTPAATSAA
ncbi:helix-turn-helix domain-containing protein, partial [Kitasatospora sp. NPDC058263]